ncbi:unnamed protein product [Prunus armeniaca]
MRAVSGRGKSWGWKGILQGRKILEASMRWHIGNGQQVRICLDNWVPKPSTFKIYSRHPNCLFWCKGLLTIKRRCGIEILFCLVSIVWKPRLYYPYLLAGGAMMTN